MTQATGQSSLVVQPVPSHTPHDATVGGATLFQWWQVGILPIILAWFAYRSVMQTVEKRNRKKNASLNPEEIGDETALLYIKTKINEYKNKPDSKK